MKRLASLVTLAAFALPCTASDPGRIARMKSRPSSGPSPHFLEAPAPVRIPNPKLLDSNLLQTVLLPERALAKWALEQVGIGRDRTFSGNVIGLQIGVRVEP